MRAIREILRQRFEFGRSLREISQSVGASYGAVQAVVERASEHDLKWPLPEELDDAALERLLFKQPEAPQGRVLPDMEDIDKQLRSHKGVTLLLLWQEYKAQHPDGYQYTQFCSYYRAWLGTQEPTMRQVHQFGQRVFLDFAGVTVPYTDTTTGEIKEAHIFVACLAASAYIFAHAFAAEDTHAWVLGTCLALEHFGGAPLYLVPDNPKPVVIESSRYEPILNRTFFEMAEHYGCVVEPARPRKPRDKAAVENAVQQVERGVLAPMRNRQFSSLGELQVAVGDSTEEYNQRPFQKREGSRQSLLDQHERPALRPLPPQRYDFAIWKKLRVSLDYHIEVDKSLYSVPYQLVHQQVDVRIGTSTVAVFHQGRQVALHPRALRPGEKVTNEDHMASSHRRYAEWTPSRIVHWAAEIGPKTAELVQGILDGRPHPEMGFRSCVGIIRLEKHYGKERLEAACTRALAIQATSYRSVRSILEKGLDRLPLPSAAPPPPPDVHGNVRGGAFYS